jgi:site-specific DNA-methyltransferase (adenine-specific)
MNRVLQGENLGILRALPSASIDLAYIDPPFNTGKRQTRTTLRTVRDEHGDRTGFKGHRYRSEALGTRAYDDAYDDYLGFLAPRLVELHRLLRDSGSLIVHLDPRESHYVKVFLDGLFGRENFQNEIIWAYDYGGRGKRSWPAKHDVLLWYSKHPERYTFDYDAIDRVPYLAPGLVGADKAARGKVPTDVWWHTIVSPTGKEKTGYPTQKPLGILERIVRVHSRPGDLVLDAFAGSGTTGMAAASHGRKFLLIDENPEAIEVMRQRFKSIDVMFDDTLQPAQTPDLFA